MNVNKIRRPADMERITTPKLAKAFIEEQVALIKEQVGDKKVLLEELERQMKEAAKVLDFERAMELRDMIEEIKDGK